MIKIAGGLADPVNIASPDDGTGRLFIVERVGRIRILDADGTLLEEPFLDLSELVQNDYLEQGLLGLAFHPDYANNGRFYVNFTDYHTNGDTFVMEFVVSEDDLNIANRAGGRLLLAVDQPYVNHNGGTIHFGPDGYLYIGMGDGGLGGDPYDTAQDRASLLGKLLRIDVDPEGGLAYGIPADNPYSAGAHRPVQRHHGCDRRDRGLSPEAAYYHPAARPEIWAWGLRNPWQFNFDPATGDLYIADVGQVTWRNQFQPADSPGGVNLRVGYSGVRALLPGWHGRMPAQSARARYLSPSTSTVRTAASITGIGVYRGERPTRAWTFISTPTGARGAFGAWSEVTTTPGFYQQLPGYGLAGDGLGSDTDGNLYT